MTAKNSTPSGAGKPAGPGDHVYLIDGSGYIFRAYHALPPLTRSMDGAIGGAGCRVEALARTGLCQLWR